MIAPPDYAIEAALKAARRSPCAKSKRGVCIFHRHQDHAWIAGVGFNGQPGGTCDQAVIDRILSASAVIGLSNTRQPTPREHEAARRCRNECGKLCVHAEVRAIRAALTRLAAGSHGIDWSELEAVHVKAVDGKLIAGGGPSCWQCSREVHDVGLGRFWLYQSDCGCSVPATVACPIHHRSPDQALSPTDPVTAAATQSWRGYTAAEFHQATLVACNLTTP